METHSVFNTLDYIVIGVILFSGLMALIRGLMREVFSVASWLGAYFAAVKLYPLALPSVQHHIKSENVAEWVAMGVVFCIALIILMVIGSLICGLIKGQTLTAIDRSLGFLFGLGRGVGVVCAIYLMAVLVLWPDIDAPKPAVPQTSVQKADAGKQQQDNSPPDLLLTAKTRPMLAKGAEILKQIIPKEMLDKTLKNVEQRKDNAQKMENQKMLDMLSTPAPPAPAANEGSATPTTSASPESKP